MEQQALFLQLELSPSMTTPVMLGLMLAIFYFFLIRPQAQRQKKQTAFQEAVKKGDQVITSAGIMGRVSKVDKEAGSVTLEVGKNTYLDFTPGSISHDLTVAKYGEAEDK